MLAADKLQLQSSLKQQATALKEKEFNLHHSNLMTVGTQAAVLAGLDITMFIEFQPPHNSEWGSAYPIPRTLKFVYYTFIVAAFCSNILVVSQTTLLSVLGAGLALRGPDGSMMTATDALYEERKSVFYAFGVGLACTVGSVVVCVWLILSWEAAVICMSFAIYTGFKIYTNYLRVMRKFEFDESETVDFTDIFEGPAAIRAVWSKRNRLAKSKGAVTSNRKSSTRVLAVGSDSESASESSPTEAFIPPSRHGSHHGGGGDGRGSKGRPRKRLTQSSSQSSWVNDYDYDDRNGDVEIGKSTRDRTEKPPNMKTLHMLTV